MLALSALIAGCNQSRGPAFELTDVTGAGFGRELTLTDHTGKTRTLADFKGKAVAIFFGYTHCPDVCPVTLSEMAAVANDLGKDADRLQVLFVTVDPERDTAALLAQYVPAFNPSFLGLRAEGDALTRTTREYKVFVQKQPAKGADGYSVDHSAGTFIYDQAGRLRLYAQYGKGVPVLVHDLRELLAGK